MQIKKAARVLPEPVGAEMSVVSPARMRGQPCSCGSVGVPKRLTNQSRTSGWAHSRPEGANCGFVALICNINYKPMAKGLLLVGRGPFGSRGAKNTISRRMFL